MSRSCILKKFSRSFLLFPFALIGIFALAQEEQEIEEESPVQLELRYSEAALVAQVEVIDIHRDVDSALSQEGITAVSGYIYSAELDQIWKGSAVGEITFRLGIEYCDKKLEKGERYLIFASLDGFGRLQLRSCDSVIVESDAEAILAELKAFTSQG